MNTLIVSGITLLELLITLVIVSILMSIAIAMYTTQISGGRRADGINSLVSISLAEEKYRASNIQYGTLAQVWGGVTTSTGGYYTLSISNVSTTGYTATATAQGNQASDAVGSTSCTTLQLIMSNGTITKSPSACWPS